MQHTVRRPLGVEVTDVDLHHLDEEEVALLVDLLAAHGVAVFPGQHIDDDAFVAFLGRFGDLVFTTGETPVPGHPDLNVVSNVGRERPPRSTFHVDSSYLAAPPAYTALRAVSIPDEGGETLFTDQYAAFDTLPDDLVLRLAGRTITHVVTGLDLGEDDEKEAAHPVFRRHPVSGRTTLYLSTPQRCAAVSGLDAAEAEQTVRRLYEHSTAESNTLRHAWSPGDVVMWDNRVVLHRADHSGVVGDRVMHRGMVADPPRAS
jgi:taurine dioxygenase